MNKLKWINSQYIKKLDTKQLTELCLPFLQEAYDLSDKSEAWIEKLVEVHRDHISCGEEIVEQVKLFFEDEIHLEEEAIEFMKDEAIPNTLAVFKSKVAELAEEDFKQDQIFACIKATQKEAKARGKMLYMPLRIATTGIMHGPDLAASMELLGKEKVLKRNEGIIYCQKYGIFHKKDIMRWYNRLERGGNNEEENNWYCFNILCCCKYSSNDFCF